MKILLFLLLALSQATVAADQVVATGRSSTPLECGWKLGIAQTPWSGQLDCQSFFNYLMLSNGSKDIHQYLDSQECDDWRDKLEHASSHSPLCLGVGSNQQITQTGC